MLITIFDSRGIIHKEFVPAGQTITGEYYLNFLKRLIARIRRIRPEYRDEDSWCLLHDNAPSHSSLIVRRFLAKNNVCVLNHPPYSLYLAPCDFYLFPKIKLKLKDLPSLGKATVGLYNIGNTCYINSTLQCLAHTAPILKACYRNFRPEELNSNSLSGGQILKKFGSLLKDLWSEEKPFRPIAIHQQVGVLEPRFGDLTQQDSMEYLEFLVQQIHEDFQIPEESTKMVQTRDEGMWQSYLTAEKSPINDMFAGRIESNIFCQSCSYHGKNYEIFKSLSLAIPTDKKDTNLMDCLNEFLKPEVLNDHTCSTCKQRGSLKTYGVSEWPTILVLHFKRFCSSNMTKMNQMVDYPLKLELSQLGNNLKYDLYAVINHQGTLEYGHYTAYCMHPISAE
ncbi:USP2, partial [Cordylochernes scorpioides]